MITAASSSLLVIDVQEKLIPTIYQHQRVVENCAWLMEVANFLKQPVILTEQYPKGLGPTSPTLRQLWSGQEPYVKSHFSCMSDTGCREAILAASTEQVILVGIEAHVCVMQTAIELLEADRDVFVVADAASSRSPEDAHLALERLRQYGVDIVSKEMVLFEWLRRCDIPEFKVAVQRFLK